MDELMISQSHDCSSPERLQNLLGRLMACLPGLPGFQTLSLFGSLAEGRADGYSDLDLIVMTDDLPAAQQHLLSVLAEVGPVECCWVIGLRPDEWNPTIIFAEEGYYHKLDLGVMSADTTDPTIPPEQTTLLVTRTDDHYTLVPRQSGAYVPPYGSIGHFLLGQYLGGTRYLKARKRGKALTCYRFATAAADWCMRALYVAMTGEGTFNTRLSTGEYATLDHLDETARGSAILCALDYSTPAAMDQALCASLQHLHDLCTEIAAARGEVLNDAVFQRMLAFMRHELVVNQ